MAHAVLNDLAEYGRTGVTTREVDRVRGRGNQTHGARSAFLGYRNFPANICISVNDEVVHGIGGSRQLQFGDIVSLDVGVLYNGDSSVITPGRRFRWAVAIRRRSG